MTGGRALVLYATATGRTRRVAVRLGHALAGHRSTDTRSIRDLSLTGLTRYGMVVAGSPTYGVGEWHPAWAARAAELAHLDLSDRCVALFALGDRRYHGSSFGGALEALHAGFLPTGARIIGAVRPGSARWAMRSDVAADARPGLVLDEVSERHLTGPRIDQWITQLIREMK